MSQFNRNPLIRRLIINVGAFLLHIWFSTCRVQIIGREYYERYIIGPNKVIGATWHRNALFMIWFARRCRPMIMFSRSRDGDLIAGVAEKFGVVTVRGSTSSGGRTALKQMKAYLDQKSDAKVATVLDGPRGPRFIAKSGMLVLAKISGVPFLPIMVSAKPAYTFKNAWDRTILPLPFSRIIVAFEKPMHIPTEMDRSSLENLNEQVQKQLNRMMTAADRMTGYTGNEG